MAKKENRHAELVSASANIDAPYELPEGWEWCRLPECVSIVTGKKDANYGTPDGKYLFFTCAEQPLRCDDYSFEGESLLLPGNGANVGQVIYYDGQFEVYQRTYVLQKIIESFSLKYLYYHILGFWENYNHDKQYGSATNYIKMGNFLNYIFPLPPTLAEQQRIVNRIETMFSKLDQAQEKAQAVLNSFETRKAAILHKAFNGELTANWRKENGVSDDSWEEKRFDEVADIKSNLVDVAEYQDFPHIAPDNIEKKTGVLLEYHTVAEDKVKSGKHRFYAGQILYSKIRPYLSKVVVVNFDGVCSADMYPIEAKGDTRFLWYQMLSNEFLDRASNSGSRSVLPKINQKELSVIPMRTCSLPEQQEIVRILDSVLEKETRAKEAAQSVLNQIALLKKSILARAFRGEV